MGFFQDFTNFVGEVSSLKDEMIDIKDGVTNELLTNANEVSQTVSDTATNLRGSAEEIKTTIQETTSLKSDER